MPPEGSDIVVSMREMELLLPSQLTKAQRGLYGRPVSPVQECSNSRISRIDQSRRGCRWRWKWSSGLSERKTAVRRRRSSTAIARECVVLTRNAGERNRSSSFCRDTGPAFAYTSTSCEQHLRLVNVDVDDSERLMGNRRCCSEAANVMLGAPI